MPMFARGCVQQLKSHSNRSFRSIPSRSKITLIIPEILKIDCIATLICFPLPSFLQHNNIFKLLKIFLISEPLVASALINSLVIPYRPHRGDKYGKHLPAKSASARSTNPIGYSKRITQYPRHCEHDLWSDVSMSSANNTSSARSRASELYATTTAGS